jgi:hypothetical protein
LTPSRPPGTGAETPETGDGDAMTLRTRGASS